MLFIISPNTGIKEMSRMHSVRSINALYSAYYIGRIGCLENDRRSNNMNRTYKRGEIYNANLNPVIGSEQGGTRPVLIISNDIGNKHSPTVIIAHQ